MTNQLRDKAACPFPTATMPPPPPWWSQLGTSESRCHVVEVGAFTVDAEQAQVFGLESGEYLALPTHSDSRGTGAQVCDFYSKRAMARHDHLPEELKHLAWLSLDDAGGRGVGGEKRGLVDGRARNTRPR